MYIIHRPAYVILLDSRMSERGALKASIISWNKLQDGGTDLSLFLCESLARIQLGTFLKEASGILSYQGIWIFLTYMIIKFTSLWK